MVFLSEIKRYLTLCGKCGKLINKWQDLQLFQQRFQVIIETTFGFVFCIVFMWNFFSGSVAGNASGNDAVTSIKSLQRPFFFHTPFAECRWYTNSCQAGAGKRNKKQKAHYQFHLFPQLYPHLNYGCLTYCMEREIKQTDEGTSQGDMWVSVESQAG